MSAEMLIEEWGMALYQHVPHPHVVDRLLHGPVRVADQHPAATPFQRVNKVLGVKITAWVGTMLCAYLFAVLALVSLPSVVKTGDTVVIVAWITQTLIQLVLLPIIIVGQNVQAEAADARSMQTFKDAEAILAATGQTHEHLTAQDVELQKITQAVLAILSKYGPIVPPPAAPGPSS